MTSKGIQGFDLFLRFADGCRCYLEDRGAISKKESREIADYLREKGKRPTLRTIRKLYYVAYPGLERVRKRLGKASAFDRDVVREFYAVDHNIMKCRQGNFICLAFPARVREVGAASGRPGSRSPFGKTLSEATLELEPLRGTFRLGSDIPLREGDWVILHRMNIIERIDRALAARLSKGLKDMGFDKERAFPRKAYKYLMELKDTGMDSGLERHPKVKGK